MGAPAVTARPGRKRRGGLFNDRGLEQPRLARRVKNLLQLPAAQLNDILARARHQFIGRADDQLQVLEVLDGRARSASLPCYVWAGRGCGRTIEQRLVENPLGGVVEQSQIRLSHHHTVKQIGRASCRERVTIWVVGDTSQKTK